MVLFLTPIFRFRKVSSVYSTLHNCLECDHIYHSNDILQLSKSSWFEKIWGRQLRNSAFMEIIVNNLGGVFQSVEDPERNHSAENSIESKYGWDWWMISFVKVSFECYLSKNNGSLMFEVKLVILQVVLSSIYP